MTEVNSNQNKVLTLEATAMLIGTIIGAGIFVLPFVFVQAGFITGLVVLVGMTLTIILLNLLIGEMVLSSKEPEQIVGLGRKYFGNFGRWGMFVTLGFGLYGPLIAYLIGEGQVISVVSGHDQPLFFSLIFFIFGVIFVYLGLDFLKRWELFFLGLILTVIIFLVVTHGSTLNFSTLVVWDWHKLFIPFGAIFFAFLGGSSIPPMRTILVGRERFLKRALIIGTIVPAIVYLVFVAVVVGITGLQTTEIATLGLGAVLGQSFLIVSNIFAIFIMATSFLTLGTTLSLIYQKDLGLSRGLACALTCLPPLILVLAGLNNFVGVISFVGALSGGLQGFILLICYYRLKKYKLGDRVSEYKLPAYPLIICWLGLVFIGGVIFAFWH